MSAYHVIRTIQDTVENSKKYSKECLLENIIDNVIGFIDNENAKKYLKLPIN